jgi:hypothetical protein
MIWRDRFNDEQERQAHMTTKKQIPPADAHGYLRQVVLPERNRFQRVIVSFVRAIEAGDDLTGVYQDACRAVGYFRARKIKGKVKR